MNNKVNQLSDAEPIVEEQHPATTMNIELLCQVAAHIVAHSKEFDMRYWCNPKTRKLPRTWQEILTARPPREESCGTTFCLAGWAVKLAGKPVSGNIPATAQELLGLTLEQAKRLFYADNWPERFRPTGGQAYHIDNSWLAAERIKHFIATEGRE